jgi:hypothetical protein
MASVGVCMYMFLGSDWMIERNLFLFGNQVFVQHSSMLGEYGRSN